MQLSEAMRDYLLDLAIGNSPQTVDTYRVGLHRFSKFLETVGIKGDSDVTCLTVRHALQFAGFVRQQVRVSTMKGYLSAVSRFFMYCLREEILNLTGADLARLTEAFKSYRRAGRNRKLPKLPDTSDVDKCLGALYQMEPGNTARRELERLRNIAMVEALRSSGMRVGELVGIKRVDLNADTRSARVTGKGDKMRVVFFDVKTWEAIQAYLLARDLELEKRLDHAVFARHDRRIPNQVLPMTTDGVRFVFIELRKAAGIEFHMTPHCLRHRFGTDALNGCHDLATVQHLMGHSSPITTEIYAEISPSRLQEAHRSIFKE